MVRIRAGTFITLVYDALRLFIVLWLLAAFTGELQGFRSSIVLAASIPQALFALMALFLLLDSKGFSPYIPLYTAGKLLSGILFMAVSIAGMPSVVSSGSYIHRELLIQIGILFTLGIFDILSAVLLKLSLRVGDATQEQAADRSRSQTAEGVH